MLQRVQPAERVEPPHERGASGLPPNLSAPIAAESTDSLVRLLVFATAAGVAGAFGWFVSVLLTDDKLGLVAVGVGWLVGFAALRGARGTGSVRVASASVAVALASLLLGKYFIVSHAPAQDAGSVGMPGLGTFVVAYPGTVGLMDVVFDAIGAWQAWSVPARAGSA